eukprot:6483753-Amphidinium_carterae.1
MSQPSQGTPLPPLILNPAGPVPQNMDLTPRLRSGVPIPQARRKDGAPRLMGPGRRTRVHSFATPELVVPVQIKLPVVDNLLLASVGLLFVGCCCCRSAG